MSFVQRGHVYGGTNSPLGSTTTGNTVVVFVQASNGITDCTLDGVTQSPDAITNLTVSYIAVFVFKNITGGAGSISITVTGDGGYTAYEYSGIDTTTPIDAINTDAQAIGDLSIDLSGASGSGVVLIGWGSEANDSFSAFSGTPDDSHHDTSHYDADARYDSASPGTFTISVTGVGTSGVGVGVLLKPGSAPPPSVTGPYYFQTHIRGA